MKRAWLCCALLAALGCSRADRAADERCAAVDAGTPVDPLLLAFLSRARSAHHLADEREAVGDLQAAAAPLAKLGEGPLPAYKGGEQAPEVREVLADTYARLADLRSRLGAFEQALSDVRAGLLLVREPNYFRGHLLETEGLIEERHAKALATSDPAASAALRLRAIGLLEQAMEVQAQVLQGAASGPPASLTRPTSPSAAPRPGSSGQSAPFP